MRTSAILAVLFLFIVGMPAALMQDTSVGDADQSPVTMLDTQTILMTSTTNKHDYRIWVALPDSYDTSDKSYPVMYVLDPSVSFQSVVEFARWLAVWDELPEMVIVGIGYPTDSLDEVSTLRERDYYTSLNPFLGFIADELIPQIDSTFRTDNTDRALIGFSYGADFVFHVLVNQPETFNRYVAIDGEGGAVPRLVMGDDEEFRNKFVGLNVKLFISATGTEFLSKALQTRNYEGLQVTGLSLGDVTHAAALHLSLPAGIMAVYAANS